MSRTTELVRSDGGYRWRPSGRAGSGIANYRRRLVMTIGNTGQDAVAARWTIVTPKLSTGPRPKVTKALAAALARRNIAVDVLYLEHHGTPIELPSNVSLHPLRGRARNSLLQIARHLRERKPEVVVSMTFLMNPPCLLASRLARYRGILLVNEVALATSAGSLDYPRLSRRTVSLIYNALYGWCHSIVCVSESTKAALEEVLRSDRVRRKLTVIVNPVDLRSPGSSAVELPFEPNGEPIFLSLGRLNVLKRIDLSIAALSMFVARNRVGHLLVAGLGLEEPYLRRLANDLGVEDRVHFLGYVANTAQLLSEATVLLHLAASEAFGNAVAESLTMGTPAIVAQGSGGPEELIGEGGIAVPADPLSVSLAMGDIWNNKEKLMRMHQGALIAAKRFVPEAVADEWIALAQSHGR